MVRQTGSAEQGAYSRCQVGTILLMEAILCSLPNEILSALGECVRKQGRALYVEDRFLQGVVLREDGSGLLSGDRFLGHSYDESTIEL